MSQIHKGIFGALAISVMFGAVQLAFAHDLIGGKIAARAVPETGVNRAAKADRATVPASAGQSQTISLRPDGLADTSVLVRVPVAREARNETRDRPAPSSVSEIRHAQDRGRLRACRERSHRSRETARARPLRDVSGLVLKLPSAVIAGRSASPNPAGAKTRIWIPGFAAFAPRNDGSNNPAQSTKLPDGQITSDFRKYVSSPRNKKYFSLSEFQITAT